MTYKVIFTAYAARQFLRRKSRKRETGHREHEGHGETSAQVAPTFQWELFGGIDMRNYVGCSPKGEGEVFSNCDDLSE